MVLLLTLRTKLILYHAAVEELLKYGAHINKSHKLTLGKGSSPLRVATKNGQEVAKLLISYGANVNARDETGNANIFCY